MTVEELLRGLNETLRNLVAYHLMGIIPIHIEGQPQLLMQGLGKDDTLTALRESIRIRSNSIVYHLNRIDSIDNQYNTAIQKFGSKPEGIGWKEWSGKLMEENGILQSYYADDVIFHIVSLFDYIGRMIVYILQGDVNRKANWKDAVKYARDPGSKANKKGYRIDASLVAKCLIKHEQEFLQKLADFRADIYHREMYFPKVSSTMSSQNFSRNKIEVKSSEELFKWMKRSIDNVGNRSSEYLLLKDALRILVEEAFRRAIDVLHSLWGDVNQKNQQETPFQIGEVQKRKNTNNDRKNNAK